MSYKLTEGALVRICAQQKEVENAIVQVLGHYENVWRLLTIVYHIISPKCRYNVIDIRK